MFEYDQVWYEALVKSPLNPPSWVFGPVWTALYIMMIVAFVIVLRRGLRTDGVVTAGVLFVIQLALNLSWSPTFFGAQMPGLALLIILALDLAVVATILAFARVSKTAAWLLVPYLAWISFASYLNAYIFVYA